MNNAAKPQVTTFKKLHVEATVLFAINHIPSVDRSTLEQFLELVNATGNFGSISEDQLEEKMELIMKYVPRACKHSLFTLAELLDIRFPAYVVAGDVPAAVIAAAGGRTSLSPAWQQ